METIKELLAEQPHQAFVQLWLRLSNDFPWFLEAEQACADLAEHERRVGRIIDALYENESLKARNLEVNSPLDLLAALDRYLHERYDHQGEALPPRIMVAEEFYLIHRRFFRKQTRHDRQTGHPHTWLHHHWIIPESIGGITIGYRWERLASISLDDLEKDGIIQVFAPGFADSVTPKWEEGPQKGLLALELSDRERRRQSIRAALEIAAEKGARILVMPELTVCPELRGWISSWLCDHPELPFYLVLPGTFHQKFPEGTYNYGELLGPTGKTLLEHRKIVPYGPKDESESITGGKRIELLNTPFGLLAMPICRDFCEEGSPFATLWEHLGVDWLLVPAMGDNLGAHQRRAATLRNTHGTVSVVANQNPEGLDANPGFVCHANEPQLEPCRNNACIAVKFRI